MPLPRRPRRQATTDTGAIPDGMTSDGAISDGAISDDESPEDEEIDAIEEEPETGPMRRCVVTRTSVVWR